MVYRPVKNIAVVEFGQSNCLGTNSIPTTRQTHLPYLKHPIDETFIVTNSYQYHQLNYEVSQKAFSTDAVSSNLACANRLHEELKLETVGYAKYAVGATSLWDDWDINTTNLNELIKQAKVLKAQRNFDEWHLFNWQGERDATSPTYPASYTEDWGVQFEKVVREIEAQLDVDFKTIGLVKLNESIVKDATYIANHRSECDRLANANARYYALDGNDYELGSDDLHYTVNGQNAVGIARAKKIINN